MTASGATKCFTVVLFASNYRFLACLNAFFFLNFESLESTLLILLIDQTLHVLLDFGLALITTLELVSHLANLHVQL